MDQPSDKQPTDNLTQPQPVNQPITDVSPQPAVADPVATESDRLADIEMGEDSQPEVPVASSPASDINQALNREPAVTPASSPVVTSKPVVAAATNHTAAPKKSKKLGLIISLIIALAVLLGGGAFAYKTFVIDNQPQNFVDRALSQTMRNEQPVKVTYKLDAGKQDGPASIAQALQGHMVFDPKSRLATYRFELDNQMIGTSKIDLSIDIPKQTIYSKVQLDKKVLNLAQSFLPGIDTKSNSILEKLYNSINDKWFIVNQEIAKELMESNGADISKDSTKDLKNLLDQCRSGKDLEEVKLIEVTKELDPKDDARVFEVKFSKTRFEESLEQQPNNQCLKEFKKQFDKNKKEFNDSQKLVLTIDKKTMLLRSVQIADKEVTVNLDFSYNTNDKVELPTDAKPLSELKTMIENIQQELMMSMVNDFSDANIKTSTPSRHIRPLRS